MKKIFSKEVVIGLSVAVAIIILIFGIDFLKGINLFQPTNFYVVEYENVAGLEKSAPVTINGFKVGQVRDMQFDYEKPGKVKVVLALNHNLRLAEDTKAQLASTLLSGAYVDLIPGKGGKMLEVGATIAPVEGTDLMATVKDQVLPQVYSILPQVDSLLANVNRLVADPALSQSIGRLDGITDNVLLTSQGLNKSINTQLPLILGNANRAVVKVDTIAGNLALLSAQLKALPIEPTMQNIEALTTNLEEFSRQLNNPNSTLGQLTTDSELYDRLNRVTADVDSLIVDIKKNPKRYISIKLL